MKFQTILLVSLLLTLGCKQNDTEQNEIIKEEELLEKSTHLNNDSINNENLLNEKSENKIIQLDLLRKSQKPQKIVFDKHVYQENNKTILDFHYPILNEEINKEYFNFNKFIKNELVEETIDLMEENEEFIPLCDSIKTRKQKSKITYAINKNVNFLSTVFVIENFYSESMHSNVSFKTVNYDLNSTKIIQFEEYFRPNTKQAIFQYLNKIILSNINSGEMYYDCWEISEGDFELYKNNFKIDEDKIRFYFDDCVVCPSYTGTYYVEVTKNQLQQFIREAYLLKENLRNKL